MLIVPIPDLKNKKINTAIISRLFVVLHLFTILLPVSVFLGYIITSDGDQWTSEHFLATLISGVPYIIVMAATYVVIGNVLPISINKNIIDCNNCGATITQKMNFCASCGNDLKANKKSGADKKSPDKNFEIRGAADPAMSDENKATTTLKLTTYVSTLISLALYGLYACLQSKVFSEAVGYAIGGALFWPFLIVGLSQINQKRRNQRYRYIVFIWMQLICIIVAFKDIFMLIT